MKLRCCHLNQGLWSDKGIGSVAPLHLSVGMRTEKKQTILLPVKEEPGMDME